MKGVSSVSEIGYRRMWVARFQARGLSEREVREALGKLRILNPRTGRDWSLGTIHNDFIANLEEWQDFAARSIDQHRGRIMAELQEVKRKAWADGTLSFVLRALQQERAVLGIDRLVDLEAQWMAEMVELLQTGALEYEEVVEELGESLAKELFTTAGIPVDQAP